MNTFLTRRIPAIFGYLIILLIAGALGTVIFIQLYRLMNLELNIVTELPE